MSKHTPGPWLFRAKDEGVYTKPPAGTLYTYGTWIFGFRDDCAPSDADLALVISAPCLKEALQKMLDAQWLDTRELQFDETMIFGHGYDFAGWHDYRLEIHTSIGIFAVWKAHGYWHAYGGPTGSYWGDCGKTAEDAKQIVLQRVCAAAPNDPISLAIAAIAKASGDIS